jgi:hypothetical protein
VPEADEATAEIEEVRAWAAGLEAVHARIASRREPVGSNTARGPSSMDASTHPFQRRATGPYITDSPRSTAKCPDR